MRRFAAASATALLLLLAACSPGAPTSSPTTATQPTAAGAPTAAPGQAEPTGAYPAPPASTTATVPLQLTPDVPHPQLAPIEDVVRRYIAAQMAGNGNAASAELDPPGNGDMGVKTFPQIRAQGKLQDVFFSSYTRMNDSDVALAGGFQFVTNDGRSGYGGFATREHYVQPANCATRWLLYEFDFIQ